MRAVLFPVLCLPLLSPALADEIEYEAVWNDGTIAAQASASLTLDDFLATGQQIAQSGMFLFDVETEMRDGTRLYVGTWRPIGAQAFNRFVGPIGPIEFGDLWREMRAEGRRIEDFEVFRTPSGGRRYLVVWRSGAGEERITGPMLADAFDARGTRMAEDGLSLVDVEVERFNGNTLYHGVFRTETTNSTTRMTFPMTRSAFTAERDARLADGQELVDMETVEVGGEVHYVGLWRQGGGPSAISALRPFGEFGPFAAAQTDDGRTLADLELQRIVPEPTPVQPPPSGISTADFPDTPAWIELRTGTGTRDITVRFDPVLPDPGFRLSLHTDHLPVLPLNEAGFPVMPDNFCGLRIYDPDRTLWLDEDGQTIDTPDSPNPSFPTIDYGDSTELQAFALSGVTFAGPMGGCEGANDAWRFDFPITDTSTGGPPNRTFVAELAEEVAFLNHNVPLETPMQPGLKPKDYFKPAISKLIEDIAKAWEAGEDETGYCDGLADFIDALCEAEDQTCPLENPSENC